MNNKKTEIKIKTKTAERRIRDIVFRKMNLTIFCFPFAVILLKVAKSNTEFTEKVFAQKIFKIFSYGISAITRWLPFSLAEMIFIALPFLLLAHYVIVIRRTVKRLKTDKKWFVPILSEVIGLACAFSIGYGAYAVGCGVNYSRYNISTHLNLTVEPSSAEDLYGLCEELAIRASALREQLPEDENGVYMLPYSKNELAKAARESFVTLAEQNPIFKGPYVKPKLVLFSRAMSYLNLTGIYTCYTMEANVNVDCAPYSFGSTMCHELAHLRGFIREDEANYVSYLACMSSDDINLQYSGTLMALIYAGNALYGKNSDLYMQNLVNYSNGVRRDFIANNEYWKEFEKTKISEVSEAANDTYLKKNDQEDGVESYGRVVDLLLAEYKSRKNK